MFLMIFVQSVSSNRDIPNSSKYSYSTKYLLCLNFIIHLYVYLNEFFYIMNSLYINTHRKFDVTKYLHVHNI
ncbi:hypothetical protein C2G38_2123708 [Gigaspora rosea]|uniref:Uncharacterized protein n=1 Tax=Gigaspora rosea TaxID=44941 RepID=A0A397TYS4_9GLOM|nr:hypothetical protein C2G38_2123708 [Gigaspora rosea]